MTTQEKAAALLEKARTMVPTVSSWVDFSNQFFDPSCGLVARTFLRSKERRAFYDMPEYEELNAILLALIKRSGGVGAATKSGKFMVRIPKTLHTVLDVEAEQEGISLNQLALAKLSVNLGAATSA